MLQLPKAPNTLQPYLGANANAVSVRRHVYQTLYTLEASGGWQGVLATAGPEPLETGPGFSVRIRSGVTFSDGTPVTAARVRSSILASLNPYLPASTLTGTLAYLSSIELDSATTNRLIFRFSRPFYQNEQAIGALPIAYSPAVEGAYQALNVAALRQAAAFPALAQQLKALADSLVAEENTFTDLPAGTGAYEVAEWRVGRVLRLSLRASYWGNDTSHQVVDLRAYPSQLVYKVVPEYTTALLQLEQGALDAVSSIPRNLAQSALAEPSTDKRARLYTLPTHNYSLLGFNQLPVNRWGYFTDVRVRQAIEMAIDQVALTATVYDTLATPMPVYALPGKTYLSQGIEPLPNSQSKARGLLAEAGWIDFTGDGIVERAWSEERIVPLRPELVFSNQYENFQRMALVIQEQLKAIGVDVVLRGTSFEDYRNRLQTRDFDLALVSLSEPSGYGQPADLWHGRSIGAGFNFWGMNDPLVNAAVEQLEATQAADSLTSRWQALQETLRDQAAAVFLANPKLVVGISKRFKGVELTAERPGFDPSQWWVPKDEALYHRSEAP